MDHHRVCPYSSSLSLSLFPSLSPTYLRFFVQDEIVTSTILPL